MRSARPTRVFTVSCPCGAQIAVDPKAENRSVACRQCGVSVDFVVTFDPKVKGSKVSIVVPRAALASGQSKPPAKPPSAERIQPDVAEFSPAEQIIAACSCGARLMVDAVELTSVQTCDRCGASFHVVVKRIPGTPQREVILVPEEPFAGRKKMAKPPSSSDPAPKTRSTKFGSKMKVARVPAPKKPKAPSEPPPGTQPVRCPCGETLFVYRREVGKEKGCTGCGRTLRIEETRDPQSLAPKVVATPVREAP